MDFPLQLIPNPAEANDPSKAQPGIGSNLEFAYGMVELKQDIFLLFKQFIGSFLQSPDIGTTIAPHQILDEYIESAASRTVEQLNGVSCEGVRIVDGYIQLRVRYKDNISDFSFSVDSFA